MKNEYKLEKLLFTPHQSSFQVILRQTVLVADVILFIESIPRKHDIVATGGAPFLVCINNFVISQRFLTKNSKFFKIFEKIQTGQMLYICIQKFLRHQFSLKITNLSAYVHVLHTFSGNCCGVATRG